MLILPVQARRGLHNYVKAKLKDTIQVQCIAAGKLQDFYRTVVRSSRGVTEVRPDLGGRYTSYLRYAALGLLIVNRQWGWVLADGTHYDGYISFDVLNNHAAFSFFYQGGRKCFVRTYPSRQKEKLLKTQVRQIVYEALKEDSGRGIKLNSLVLRRDGRLFDSEWQGFSEAMNQLVREGLLPRNVLSGAVEVHKSTSNAVRIAKIAAEGLINPRIGIAAELSDTEGVVCNTGYPFKLKGSVNPLLVQIAHGDLSLSKILEDTFSMSLLCFPVPDRVIRLPIDMKLCDEFLRAVAADADEDEALYDDERQLSEAVNAS